MEDKPPHYLRQWREFRKMTLREMAKEVGTTPSTVSDLETHKLQLSPKWLRRFAPILKCQEGYIIDYDPNDLDTDVVAIWGRILEEDKEQAIRVLQSFVRTGTDD